LTEKVLDPSSSKIASASLIASKAFFRRKFVFKGYEVQERIPKLLGEVDLLLLNIVRRRTVLDKRKNRTRWMEMSSKKF
jgi:hypothetical protein